MRKSYFLYLILGFVLLLTGCTSRDNLKSVRDCPIEQLLLDQSDYPPNTILNEVISPVADKPIESADQSAGYLESGLFQVVIRYSSSEKAAAEYDAREKSVFAPEEVIGSWEIPPVLNLNNLSADRYEIACGNVVSFGKRCYMIGQYEKHYVFFRADIVDNGVTHEVFRDLVLKINDRMASCLNK
jgi:hypothetical protein